MYNGSYCFRIERARWSGQESLKARASLPECLLFPP